MTSSSAKRPGVRGTLRCSSSRAVANDVPGVLRNETPRRSLRPSPTGTSACGIRSVPGWGLLYLGIARTGPRYRLLTIAGAYPLLMDDHGSGGSIAVEVFAVTREMWRGKVDQEPDGLVEGTVELSDGRTVAAMLGDPAWVRGRRDVQDITEYGVWAHFVARMRGDRPS